MKTVLFAALALLFAQGAQAEAYQCKFQSGAVVEARFPCEPAMLERFTKRLLELHPQVREINTSPDYIMNLYIFAMTSCTGQFARMTPEEIGVNSEPFFPKEMMAAMVKAGREVMCPQAR
jgi:hypothetical protein